MVSIKSNQVRQRVKMLASVVLTILLVGQKVVAQKGEDIFDFGVCPKSHPFAFQSGQQCCSERITDSDCRGEAIKCNSNSCEDHSYCCADCCKGSCRVGEDLQIENLSADYDGKYYATKYLEANRPIFEGSYERDGKCIWWHRLYRHWWIGYCDDIGDNAGFAYINEDLGCPSECTPEVEIGVFPCPEKSMTWRRGGSNEVITGVLVNASIGRFVGASAAVELDSTSGTVGIDNAVNQDGTSYKQNCRFVRRNGNFVCVKKNQ